MQWTIGNTVPQYLNSDKLTNKNPVAQVSEQKVKFPAAESEVSLLEVK